MSHLYDLAVRFGGKSPAPGAQRSPGVSWRDACGALVNQFSLYAGGWKAAPSLYGPTAAAVMAKSGTRHSRATQAPIGALHWFALPGVTAGHVGLDLNGGGTDLIMATGRAVKRRLAPYLGIQSVAGYIATGATYLGWTTNYGGGVSAYVEPTPAPSHPADPTARTTVAKGANLRTTPDATDSHNIVSQLKGSTAYPVRGFRTDGAAPYALWFEVAGGWASASTFTSQSTAGLTNLTPKPTPTPSPEPAPVPVPVPEPAPVVDPTPEEPNVPKSPEPEPELTEAERKAAADAAQHAADALNGSITGSPLAGLFAGHDTGRKRAYAAFAAAALVVSFAPDVVTYGVIADGSVPGFVAIASLASSVLLKVGVAFGFVAASNTGR